MRARAAMVFGLWLLWVLVPVWGVRAEESERETGSVPDDSAPSGGGPAGTSGDGARVPGSWIAAQEVAAVNLVLWAVNAYIFSYGWAQVDLNSIWGNITHPFVHDDDGYDNNMFFHPYHGSYYHSAARSCGLPFGVSALYTFGGSLAWEVICETKPPSLNDLLCTAVSGSLLGETLFRLSRLALAGSSGPEAGRRLSSVLLSPMTGINDILFDDRFRGVQPPPPVWAGRIAAGGGGGSGDPSPHAHLGGTFTYGLPTEVEVRRPFDHFDLSLNLFHGRPGLARAVQLRGLLFGADAGRTADARLLWGLYGAFDFGGPAELRVSANALGPGFTAAFRPAEPLAVEATLLLAPSFGSGGARVPLVGERDYAYGYGALGIADLRARFRDRWELRTALHAVFYPVAVGGGGEATQIGTGSLLVRLAGPHAIALYGLWTGRQAHLPGAVYRERTAYCGLSYVRELGAGTRP